MTSDSRVRFSALERIKVMSKKGQYIGGSTVVGRRSSFFVHKSKKEDAKSEAKDRLAAEQGAINRGETTGYSYSKDNLSSGDLAWLSANDKPPKRRK
jgi:hypothetical protein